jgi:hypothetical protein
MSRLFALFLLVLAPAAQAEIYKFVDENGLVTYTNMPRPGGKPQLVIPDVITSGKSAPPATTPTKPGGKIATPSYFPKVDVGTQRKRDDMRRQLLVEELRSEERNLAAAKGALATGSRQPGSDVGKLADSVRMHEKNIEMLNKELSHIR